MISYTNQETPRCAQVESERITQIAEHNGKLLVKVVGMAANIRTVLTNGASANIAGDDNAGANCLASELRQQEENITTIANLLQSVLDAL